MRNILVSIKPEHCCNILNKDKTLEIRTTCPTEWKKYLDGKTSIKPQPCKVCIYCTKSNKELRLFNQKVCASFKIPRTKTYSIAQQKAYTKFIGEESQSLNGKVIAEFTLNKIDKIEICDPYIFRDNEQEDWEYFEKNACLTCEQMMEYIGYGEDHDGWDKKYDIGYAWHIDDLIIYDTPKELNDFTKVLDCKYCADYNCMDSGFICPDCINANMLKRPPQSWCYVEGE